MNNPRHEPGTTWGIRARAAGDSDPGRELQALVVEDDPDSRKVFSRLLRQEGFRVARAASLEEARQQGAEVQPDFVLTDLDLQDGQGLELISTLSNRYGRRPRFVVVTGRGSFETAVEALRLGASDFLVKPVDLTALVHAVDRVNGRRSARATTPAQLPCFAVDTGCGPLFGVSAPMRHLYGELVRLANQPQPVLLYGELGTGKGSIARVLHQWSERMERPFVEVSCTAADVALFDHLFFNEPLAASEPEPPPPAGMLRRIAGGTLFLREIGELADGTQERLGTLLQAASPPTLDSAPPGGVRLIASARVDRSPLGGRALRVGLLERLGALRLRIPPLRERGRDVILLAQLFLDQLNRATGGHKRYAPGVLARLPQRPWRGNLRELRNLILGWFLLSDGDRIGGIDSPSALCAGPPGISVMIEDLSVRVGTTLTEVERLVILSTLRAFGGERGRTAQALGISSRTLARRLKEYGASAAV
jgi:DNA-binding NtrC family response regulator